MVKSCSFESQKVTKSWQKSKKLLLKIFIVATSISWYSIESFIKSFNFGSPEQLQVSAMKISQNMQILAHIKKILNGTKLLQAQTFCWAMWCELFNHIPVDTSHGKQSRSCSTLLAVVIFIFMFDNHYCHFCKRSKQSSWRRKKNLD